MAAIPGASLNITGASGSQNLLSPKQGWYAYVFPRGAWISRDSTGINLTVDTSDISARFAVDDWVQIGTSTANIRKVTLVGAASVRVNSAVTASENDRLFLIGNTQPQTTGGSTTYLVPRTTILSRDDDASDRYTNSVVTTNADGLAQFYCEQGLYDVLIQDGNQSNQGYIADLAIGIAEGISTSLASVFGATVTINAAFGVTGWAVFGQTVTMNANAGVTGTFAVGATLTTTNALVVGTTATISGRLYGTTATFSNGVGVTGTGVFGATLTTTGITNVGTITASTDIYLRRLIPFLGTTLATSGFSLTAGWGATASILSVSVGANDTRGFVEVRAGGAGITDNPTISMTLANGIFPNGGLAYSFANRLDLNAPTTGWWRPRPVGATQADFQFIGLPVSGTAYDLSWLIIG
jgi:hypothetical protein